MPTMIALIALLLFVYLRSITATVYLLATVIISYFGALGAGWLILHHIMGPKQFLELFHCMLLCS